MKPRLKEIQQDILDYLTSVEPQPRSWSEIRDELWTRYEHKYKHKYPKSGKHGFGSATPRHLQRLADLSLIKKVGTQWGTLQADFTAVTLSGFSKQKLKKQFLKALGDVAAERVDGNVRKAYKIIDGLRGLAPPEWKKQLNPIFNMINEEYNKKVEFLSFYSPKRTEEMYLLVRSLEETFASVIYES